MPQGAPESPLALVVVADEILGGPRPQWESADRAWTCENVMLSCLGYADDILLFSNKKASLDSMVADCCGGFRQACLEVGQNSLDQLFGGSVQHVPGQDTKWERSLEFTGSVIEPGANWKPLLCNPIISLSERVKAYQICVLPSATWLCGCWTLAKQQEDSSSSWNARLLRWLDPIETRRALSPISGMTCIVVAMSWQTCEWRSQSRCIIAQRLQTILRGSLTTTRSLECSCVVTWHGGDRNSMLGAKQNVAGRARNVSTRGVGKLTSSALKAA